MFNRERKQNILNKFVYGAAKNTQKVHECYCSQLLVSYLREGGSRGTRL